MPRHESRPRFARHLSAFALALAGVGAAAATSTALVTPGSVEPGSAWPARAEPGPVDPQAGGGLIILPERIDLGVVAPGTTRHGNAWLVNESDSVQAVRAITGSCGCLAPDAAFLASLPRELAPGAALEVPFSIESEPVPMGKSPELRVLGDNGVVAEIPVRIVSDLAATGDTGDREPAAGGTTPAMQAVPAEVHFGAVAHGAAGTAEVWLVNSAGRDLQIRSVRAACGCTTVSGLSPGVLADGMARRLTLTMTAPKEDRAKRSRIIVQVDGLPPLVVPVEIEGVHPLAARVEQLGFARESGDHAALQALLADDSRIWYESRQGPGKPRDPLGRGAWTAWDRAMHATTERGAYAVRDREVSVEHLERNDYYRLLDRRPARVRMTYTFDADDRIVATLVEGLDPEPNRGRLDEFLAWAAAEQPAALEAVYGNGRIEPSQDQAKRWRVLLRDWRLAEG